MKNINNLKGFFLIFLIVIPFLLFCQKHTYKEVPLSLLKEVRPTQRDFQKIKDNYPNAINAMNYLPKNFVKNGSIDYTSYLQRAIDENSIILMPNFPILINSKGLILKSNSVIIFDSNSKLILTPTVNSHYQILRIYNLNNVKVYFANITGDKYSHLDSKGEFGMGISIRGSRFINITKSYIEKCWGDGLYVDDYSKDIIIDGIHVDNNRRNGISIVYGSNITINNLLASNTNGTSPMAGIDIEPDNNSQVVDKIFLNNPITYNNANRGILIALMNLPGNSKRDVNININNHIDYYSKNGLAYYPGSKKKRWNNVTGKIKIVNSDWSKSKLNPFFIPEDNYYNNIILEIYQPKILDLETRNKIKTSVRKVSNIKLK